MDTDTNTDTNKDENKIKTIFQSNSVKLSIKGDVYYINNQEQIKVDSEDKKVDENDFDRIIFSEINKIKNQNIDNIVVLFGAGASVIDNKIDDTGIAESGVTVKVLAENILKRLKDEKYKLNENEVKVYNLNDLIEKSKYDKQIKDGKLPEDFNFEDFLSKLLVYQEFEDCDKTLNNSVDSIYDIIIKATSYKYSDKFKHIKLLNILSKMSKSGKKLNIITTNYDTLIEEAAEQMKWTVFDGFSFSLTPQFDSNMFEWNLVKDVPNIKTNESIYKENVINLLKIHGSVTWEEQDNDGNVFRKSKENVKKPVMIFPSSDKYSKSYQEPYFDLFNKFQNMLQKPNTLFITIGFSFADNHIARMILNAVKTNDSLSMLVTDYNIDSEVPNWKELQKAMEDYYNITFLNATLNGKLTDYLGENINDN